MTTKGTTDRSVGDALAKRARRHVPGGVHSNTRFRPSDPLYVERASGAYLWDVDGRRLLDFQMGNGSVALGHGRAEVDAAVTDVIGRGLTTGVETPEAVRVVELMAAMIPSCRAVRFANTGTEALMHALHIARHATGRFGVAKTEGAYHGWYDALWVSAWTPLDQLGEVAAPARRPGSAGLAATEETVVLPFNDIEHTEALLRRHADDLAAVVLEPVLIDIGFVPADPAYLERLRAVTSELGIVLIFDELLTGFRLGPGGARERYGITPDLATYGKAMANGYPMAAVEGSEELFALTDPAKGGPVGWVGTYNGHPTAMAAAAASLELLSSGAVQLGMDKLVEELRSRFQELAARAGVEAVLAGAGGHFQPYFVPRPPSSYREAAQSDAERYAIWVRALDRAGILVPARPLLHCALSDAHGNEEIERLLDASEVAFAEMASAPADRQLDRSERER